MTRGALIRRISLIVLIVFGLTTIGLCYLAKLYFWMVLFSMIFISVLAFEWLSKMINDHTISTRFKHYGMKNPWFAWGILLSFLVAMVALVVHLGVYS